MGCSVEGYTNREKKEMYDQNENTEIETEYDGLDPFADEIAEDAWSFASDDEVIPW
jgi:hypothetical protein